MGPFLLMAISFVYLDRACDCFFTFFNEMGSYYFKKGEYYANY